ncbi:unnamed protein product [Cylicocyclus nassatus]|uniref:C2 domain-containing protein n=1 Tax=Cylicocyclus nassatus TaxID=53992 RepID=A0AA36GT02_CYLNA|nr:unnamed protein product [Cylicocyclus nassatus]
MILSCQVVGIDPTYGFPRICDQTASICVFKDNASDCNRPQLATITTSHPEEELGKLIEMRAKCFNVTIAVHKHKERCPWCPDPSEVTVVQQTLPDDVPSADPTSVFMRLLGDDTIMPLSMLVLAGTAVISSLGIACVLIAFLRLKRSNRQFPSKSLSQPRSRSNLVKIPIRDAPWEQTRPTYWLSSSSKYEATTTSPLESLRYHESTSTTKFLQIHRWNLSKNLASDLVAQLGLPLDPGTGLNARQAVGEKPRMRLIFLEAEK